MKSVSRFSEDLKKQGYSVKFDASFKGKSGTTHHVDVLAKDSEGRKIIAVKQKGKQIAAELISTFAISLDGEAKAYFIVDEDIGTKNLKLAKYYKIAILSPDA